MTREDLKQMQNCSLEDKILMTKQRIRDWYNHYGGQVYISFSGGKDSTALLHIARQMYSDIKAVFVDTGLEYPELKKFVKTFENVDIIRPEKNFKQIITEYGYPVISKNVAHNVNIAKRIPDGKVATKIFDPNKKGQYAMYKWSFLLDADFDISERCCDYMKKKPAKKYQKETGKYPILAVMACESKLREQSWLKNGCNAFDITEPKSCPMSFWTEQDILKYIYDNNIKIADPYGNVEIKDGKYVTTGVNRTGCVFCGFGAHLEKGCNRFELLKESHPKLYDYCINGGAYIEGKWKPNNLGLGLGRVLDYINVRY